MKDVTNSAKKNQQQSREVAVADQGAYVGSNLPVTRADFEALDAQRKMLVEFVAKQMVKDVDYGVIPGTPKPSLFKPGAEKLNRLFGLGARFTLSEKEFDRVGNFSMYAYKAEIYHLKSGHVVGECEGSCNSQEKKYKERKEWVQVKPYPAKKEQVVTATPIADIDNTLRKMAQKRAYVGGTILATGASDFFSQDLEDLEENGVPTGQQNQNQQQQKESAETDPAEIRRQKINKLMTSFKQIGVSEIMIRDKFKVDNVLNLTDEQLGQLAGFGNAISKENKPVSDFFGVKNG